MIFVQGTVTILLLVMLVWALIYPFVRFKQLRYWSLLPLTINIGTILIVIFVPFTAITIESDFHAKLNARTEVIEKIRSGELVNNVDYNKTLIYLPFGFPNVSRGGNDILYTDDNGKLMVFFFTYRGIIDNYSGIIYKEDNRPPTADDFNCGEMLDSKKFRDNWFWMACT